MILLLEYGNDVLSLKTGGPIGMRKFKISSR